MDYKFNKTSNRYTISRADIVSTSGPEFKFSTKPLHSRRVTEITFKTPEGKYQWTWRDGNRIDPQRTHFDITIAEFFRDSNDSQLIFEVKQEYLDYAAELIIGLMTSRIVTHATPIGTKGYYAEFYTARNIHGRKLTAERGMCRNCSNMWTGLEGWIEC
ncbi:hypothetical protein M422DRAFT_56313 [Sphaerobolus stellatus SS14]|uniref:Uncharacterized protein n=1 Tax=Sphaerobolus stellatus (strain SS14) TaxID=990650 RepID=A0A0C9UHH1_SPHS4|nr:hypothetical protein M422DRAFT_56313 [Sphaerobolus stellatus SS14]